jgi:hypothetical protein
MAIAVSQLIFNCTLAQFNTAMSTTLPGMGFNVLQAPIKFQGLIASKASFTYTGTTNSTTAITALSSVAGLYPGIAVSGSGIPANDTLSAVGAVNTATLAVAASTSVAGTPLTFTPTLGQCDFSFDGFYFLRFYGANPVPKGSQAQAGIVQNQMSPNLILVLTNGFAATLGAPVPSNQAVPPYNTNSL